MSAPPILRPLAFGEVLDTAFTLYRRNFGTFVGAAILPTLLMLAAVFAGGLHRPPADPETMDPAAMLGFSLVMVVAGLVTLVMWGALAHLASQAYGSQPVTVGDGYAVGLRRFLPLLGAVVVALLLLMGAGVPAAILFGILVAAAAVVGAVGAAVVAILTVVALLAFYALAAALLFAIVPAVVVEGKGPVAAIARSTELARGALLRLVGLMVVSFAIVYLPILGALVLTGTFSAVYDPGAEVGSTAFMLQQVLSWGIGALTTPFLVSVIVVQYYDRRVRTEALDVQAAADRLATV